MKTIKSKVATLIASTSVILIVAVLAVSLTVMKNNVVTMCENYLYDTCVSASNTLYESFYGDTEQDKHGRKDTVYFVQCRNTGYGFEQGIPC